MELHDPAAFVIFTSQVGEDSRLIGFRFFFTDAFAFQGFGNDSIDSRFIGFAAENIFQCMVCSAAAHFFKEGDALVHGFADIGKSLDFNAGSLTEAGHVIGITGFVDVHQLVRTHSRIYLGTACLFFFQLLMPFQIIGRVISRADDFNI